MAEAFGPYTSRELQPMPERRTPWRLVDLAVVAVAIVSAALITAGVI